MGRRATHQSDFFGGPRHGAFAVSAGRRGEVSVRRNAHLPIDVAKTRQLSEGRPTWCIPPSASIYGFMGGAWRSVAERCAVPLVVAHLAEEQREGGLG